MFYFVATGDNTTSVTINIDGLGAKAVTRDGSVALVAGDIKSGEVVVVVYDGTRFQVVSQLNSAGNATFANVSITSALNVGGIATFSAGTAAAPSITTTGDTNTGIFFPAADTIAFTEGGVEAARFDSSGNLGIGTSSPSAKLEVAGNIFVNTSGNPYAEIKTSGSGNNPYLKLTADTNSWTFQGTFSNANDDLLVLYNATTLLDLTKDGNLGLGVTPSAWISSYRALTLGYSTNGMFSGGDIQLGLTQNAFLNSGVSWIYTTSNPASQYIQINGAHQWFTAPSGTAGNAISFTQAMTLSSTADRGTLNINGNTEALFEFSHAGTRKSYLYQIGTELQIFNEANGIMAFGTNATERARITSGGELLVGTTTGGYRVRAATSGNFDATALFENTNGSYGGTVLSTTSSRAATTLYEHIACASNAVGVFKVLGNGDVQNTNNSYGAISDAKMKTDIVDAGSQWADIKAVRFRKFKMKDDPQQITQLGVVAQELEQTSPGLVDEHADRDAEGNDLGTTTKSVKSSILLMKAAVALQEAMARIEQLEAKFAALETK
jgi:hypothetical protein